MAAGGGKAPWNGAVAFCSSLLLGVPSRLPRLLFDELRGPPHAILLRKGVRERLRAARISWVAHQLPETFAQGRRAPVTPRERFRSGAEGRDSATPERLVDGLRTHEGGTPGTKAGGRRPGAPVVHHRAHAGEERAMGDVSDEMNVGRSLQLDLALPAARHHRSKTGALQGFGDEAEARRGVLRRHGPEADVDGWRAALRKTLA